MQYENVNKTKPTLLRQFNLINTKGNLQIYFKKIIFYNTYLLMVYFFSTKKMCILFQKMQFRVCFQWWRALHFMPGKADDFCLFIGLPSEIKKIA